ncbi:MAG TPA: helix-turn-helix domain-containing protein [Actinotalea sp.]|nr:helix-turn-helix domain-containing protein [Actinotalea sp.]
MSPPEQGDAAKAKPTPIRVTSVSTERRRRRVRDVEQPIINITLQPDERRVFRVVEAAPVLGISRSKLYEFIAAGEIRSIRIGRLRKIPVAAIDEFIASPESDPPPRDP